MNKLKKMIKKNNDFIYYTISFALYTFVQHLLLMPFLSKRLPSNDYSNIILFITIFNILCYAIGDEIGNTKLLMFKKYKNKIVNGDQNVLLVFSLVLSSIIIITCNVFFKMNFISLLLMLFITFFGIIRHYVLSFPKIINNYKKILLIFAFYSLGIVTGIFANYKFDSFTPLMILFSGEIFSFIYYVFTIKKIDSNCYSLKKSSLFKDNFKMYASLFSISIIFNILAYIDRIVIYPLLGSNSTNTYYAATTMSKISSLIITPVSNILLARLAISSKNYLDTIKKAILKYTIPIVLIASTFCCTMSYVGVKLFYNQYFYEAINILIPIGIAMAFTNVSAILKPIILKYYPTNKFLILNVLYSISILITIFLSYMYDIKGFAFGIMISKILLLVIYLICLFNVKEETK